MKTDEASFGPINYNKRISLSLKAAREKKTRHTSRSTLTSDSIALVSAIFWAVYILVIRFHTFTKLKSLRITLSNVHVPGVIREQLRTTGVSRHTVLLCVVSFDLFGQLSLLYK